MKPYTRLRILIAYMTLKKWWRGQITLKDQQKLAESFNKCDPKITIKGGIWG
jgi:hypothetical protein